MTVHIVYETHSTTTDNESGLATGWHPGVLSARGREQAAELGERHRAHPPDLVITSDLRRAVETAEIAFGATGTTIRADARLRECNYGDLNGSRTELVHADRLANVDRPFPGGESYRDVVLRVGVLLGELVEKDARRVVLVSHRAPFYALEHLIVGVPLEEVVVAPFVWRPGWHYELQR